MNLSGILLAFAVFTAGSLLIFRMTFTEQIVESKYAWFRELDNNVLSSTPESYQSQYADIYKPLLNISKDLKNYWLYFNSLVTKTKYSNQTNTISDGYISINSKLTKLMELSQAEREQKLQRMAQYIRDKIDERQNPLDCEKANLLLCDVDNHCGFGCSMHTTVACLMRAFLLNRTLVLRSKDWQYATEGWEYAFLPIGNCKNDRRMELVTMYTDEKEKTLVERLLGSSDQRVEDLALRIPSELAPTLLKLHGHPFAWWVSQFTAYTFRFQPWLQLKLDNLAKEIGFVSSAAGMQVRWGDKVDDEAEKHEVEEYMFFIEKWFKQLEMQGQTPKRIVYLAFEDPEVLEQLNKKYPAYSFITSRLLDKSVKTKERYQHEGLESVVMDIYFLSKCDYLVCTQSSSVCRTAYELMMNNRVDASTRFQTLDTFYTFKTSRKEYWFATMDHNPAGTDEMEMKKGDKIIARLKPPVPPHNDGFFNGENKKRKVKGRFPLFKVQNHIDTMNVPAFHDYT